MTAENELGLIPEKAVAEMLGISVDQFRRKIKGKEGPTMTKIGRMRFYTREDINAWLKLCRVPGKKGAGTAESAEA